jgi:anti-sigma regulatory factor (Ser/Thr protein kinase)/serine/threonine protein phosphatase PrpC
MTEIVDASHAGDARRRAVEWASMLGMDESDCGKVAIAATEMATNLVKHAHHGKILCEAVNLNGRSGLRVLSIDKGPGIPDVAAALRDGYSTYGSSGNGLGAVRRLSTVFDLYSQPGIGTCILAEFWPNGRRNHAQPLSFGVVSIAIRGETVCGDGWGTRTAADRSFFMVVDGLGHGTWASEAAREAERILAASRLNTAADMLRDFHDALKKTRGAAAAIAEISPEKRTLTFAGIGNISAVVVEDHGRRGIASHNGTLGHQMPRIQEFTVPWDKESLLIMHSDGLGSKWDLNQYPGLSSKHPAIIAAMLYQDFRRERDDVTVMVARNHD